MSAHYLTLWGILKTFLVRMWQRDNQTKAQSPVKNIDILEKFNDISSFN